MSHYKEEDKNYYDEDLNLIDLFNILWLGKKTIFLIVAISSIFSVAFALMLPNKYQSSVLLAPIEGGSMSNALSQYSNVASLAGISLPKESNKAEIGFEVLQSKQFIKNFIYSNDILIPLMASYKWDWSNQQLMIDQDLYDSSSKKWVRKVSFPRLPKPSMQEAYDFWMEEIFLASKDKNTGFIKYTIEHYSPYHAQEWASKLITDLNNQIRKKDVEEAEMAIQYLNNEIEKTNSTELKELLFKLVQSNTEKKMLAYSRKDYLFSIIDPAAVPEEKSSPARAIICIIGFFFGLVASLLFVLGKHFILNKDS
jgi:LPS O-antigen subunit length determinant protein (WzzB/FepE family)